MSDAQPKRACDQPREHPEAPHPATLTDDAFVAAVRSAAKLAPDELTQARLDRRAMQSLRDARSNHAE